MFFLSRKKLAMGASVAILGVGSVVAYAFFTSTGSGTGTASVGNATKWTVGESGTPSAGPMYPDAAIGGANVQTHQYTVTNGGSGSQYLTHVVISVANSDGSVWSSQTDNTKPACTASDFSVEGQTVGGSWTDTALAGDYTAGSSKTNGSVTIELIDNSTANQDNCQGLSGLTGVPLYFSAS
jgi:hypothetical protein